MNGMKSGLLERWTYKDAGELYGVHEWAAGYFDVSEKGEVVVRLPGKPGDDIGAERRPGRPSFQVGEDGPIDLRSGRPPHFFEDPA